MGKHSKKRRFLAGEKTVAFIYKWLKKRRFLLAFVCEDLLGFRHGTDAVDLREAAAELLVLVVCQKPGDEWTNRSTIVSDITTRRVLTGGAVMGTGRGVGAHQMMFGEPGGAGGAGGSGFEIPQVVGPCLSSGPGSVFMWQLPMCSVLGLAASGSTHSHTMQSAWAVHAAQQSAAVVVLAHLRTHRSVHIDVGRIRVGWQGVRVLAVCSTGAQPASGRQPRTTVTGRGTNRTAGSART